MRRSRFLIALVFVATPLASAEAVYTYTGAAFDTIRGDPGYLANPPFALGESIDLMFDFSAPLAPDLDHQTVIPKSWSFKLATRDFVPGEGVFTLESSVFSTDSLGNIDDWFISAFANPRGFSTSGTAGDEAHQFAAHDFAGTTSTKAIGTWTSLAPVPEPPNLQFLAAGLAALFWVAKRQRSKRSTVRPHPL